MLFIHVCILYMQPVNAQFDGNFCINPIAPVTDGHFFFSFFRLWVTVGSVSVAEHCASLKYKVSLCCKWKWHYPKDASCDFVNVWTMNRVGGGMYKSGREVLWDYSSLPLKKHQGRRTNSAQSVKSLSVDKANVKRISLWENLLYRVPQSALPLLPTRLCTACLHHYSEINANV